MPDGAYLGLDGVIPNRLLLLPTGAYLGPDRVISDGLYVCPGRPKVLSLGRTRGGKPPTLTTVAFFEESYKLCMLSWYALYHLLFGIS